MASYCSIGILRRFEDMVEVILPQLPMNFDSVSDAEGKAAFIWILGEYGEVITTHCTYGADSAFLECGIATTQCGHPPPYVHIGHSHS